ncbi:hypothetical protein ES702_03785 [subsurface metagenome]
MKTIISIVAITALVGIAMWQGINGALLGFAIAAIAGLGGYEIGIRRKPKEPPE